jgi:hypothetical protein
MMPLNDADFFATQFSTISPMSMSNYLVAQPKDTMPVLSNAIISNGYAQGIRA